MPNLTQLTLDWDKPMTSKQAAVYHLTGGFIAVELYRSLLHNHEEYEQRIAELESEKNRLEIENWYYEVLELVQYDWWLEIIEDVSEVGKEELTNIFKAAAKAAVVAIDV